jgi:hypothetical protein
MARDVAFGRFDLHDLSAEIGEHTPDVGAGEDAREIEDADIAERARHAGRLQRARGEL